MTEREKILPIIQKVFPNAKCEYTEDENGNGNEKFAIQLSNGWQLTGKRERVHELPGQTWCWRFSLESTGFQNAYERQVNELWWGEMIYGEGFEEDAQFIFKNTLLHIKDRLASLARDFLQACES